MLCEELNIFQQSEKKTAGTNFYLNKKKFSKVYEKLQVKKKFQQSVKKIAGQKRLLAQFHPLPVWYVEHQRDSACERG